MSAASPPRFSPKPPWLSVRLPAGETYQFLKGTLGQMNLHTVCEEAHCPNIGECWGSGTATFMVMGDLCTRHCGFCAVKTSRYGSPLDPEEPAKIARAVAAMRLDYVVITSVDRDDLPDQGAGHFAQVVTAVKELAGIGVEVLIPDFRGRLEHLRILVGAKPNCIAHNLETVRRLSPLVRDRRAGYDQSLSVLNAVKEMDPDMRTKSSLMLGLGETREEILEAFHDLRANHVDFLTLGQYLKPSPKHCDVKRYVPPEEFEELAALAKNRGFASVASGPLVRSSYHAGKVYREGVSQRDGD